MPDPSPIAGGDLLFVGDVFCDLVLGGVEMPKPGAEVYADSFALSPGGVANRAVAAARTGARTRLLGQLGDDPLGHHMYDVLAAEPRLDLTLLERVPGLRSPVTVALTGAHDRSFITYQERREKLRSGPPPALGPDPVGALHIGMEQPLPSWVAHLRAAGTTVVGGVGHDPDEDWSPAVLGRLAHTDVFVPNDVEAMRYTRTDDPVAAAKALAEHVPLAVVTRGRHGVVAVDSAQGTLTEIPAVPVTAVDPTGAGDVFVATFMAAARHSWTLAERLRYATLSAALSVTGHGGAAAAPRPPDLARFLAARRNGHGTEGDWSFLTSVLDREARR
ncbi:Ribokinase [Streptomyces sp. YIM 130001]|uniref:carbohydrate kinase family protein n=1 Tax=Streptomyces sp. YIM 130001 TaxID=2259644 RepID=UPI000EEC1256|nr:carbohydrate kinase family protein [Streptomyces sp. YIM 130001]RII13922.1 Ribokinase [Streptomyces sp. YIM 130001]